MAPNFIARARQRAAEAQEWPAEEPATSLPPRRNNPFLTAADDLAAQWDEMRQERDVLRDEAEQLRGLNIHLSERVDSLSRELATRIEFFELEIDRLTQRADRATDENVDRRAKLDIISKALLMVLNETIASAPMKREEPERTVNPVTHRMTEHGPVQLDPAEIRRNAALASRNLSMMHRQPNVQDFSTVPPGGYDVSEADAEDARDLINRLAPVALKR